MWRDNAAQAANKVSLDVVMEPYLTKMKCLQENSNDVFVNVARAIWRKMSRMFKLPRWIQED